MLFSMSALQCCMMAAVAATLSACGPPASQGGFDSANPAAKMYAIEQAARSGDRTAVRQIVEQLDSDDPAVRMLAIATLQRLTGRTYGYRDFDPPEVRRQAIQRWSAAVESDEIFSDEAANGPTSTSADSSPHG
jgi:hypothetical protein